MEKPNILEETFSWLKDPDLLENLVNDLGRFGVVGEPGNVVTVLLTYNSRLCEHPLNLAPTGDSGIGKSFLACKPSEFWKHCTQIAGYMSKTSLVHDTDWAKKSRGGAHLVDLNGKVLVILEAESSREFLNFMKPIRSHDSKEVSFNVSEREGKHGVKKVIMQGWPVFITLSVNPSVKEEDLTRDLNLTPTYSREKGRAVNLHKGKEKEEPWKHPTETELLELGSGWSNATSCLRPLKVVNPFAVKLAEDFDTRNPRSMRDFGKVFSLFDSCVLLHQYQRIIIKAKDGVEYVVGTLDDLRITLKVANILLESTVTGLRDDVLQAYREFFKKVCPPGGGKTIKEFMEDWHKVYGTVIKRTTLVESFLYPLRDAGLMNQDDSEKTHKWEVSSVNLSEPVEADPTVLLKGCDLEAGLRSKFTGLFENVGVSEVTRGGNQISMASTENAIQEILSSVQASTVRQSFIDKLGDPLASCLKSEERVYVGPPSTLPESSDMSSTDSIRWSLEDRVSRAREMFREGCDLQEIEHTTGPEVLGHCFERGLIPRVGGRRR